MLTVIEAAQKIGVSADTIRRWEKKGLIKGKRSEANYRMFNADEIMRVQQKVSGTTSENRYKILKSRMSDFTVVDLFSGAGGTALGFEHAGLRHELLVECDKFASATLKKNKPGWNVLTEDVKNVDFRPYRGKIDVVEGGFPCQSFSYAGRKEGFADTRGTLFFEFARCLDEIRPKIAVGENVRGLVNHDGGETLKTMLRTLDGLGYRAQWRVLRSQYHDVPQKRERLVILAVRKDMDLPFLFPAEQDYTISLREALADCPASEGQAYPKRKQKILSMIPPGGYWKDLPLREQKKYMGASFFMGGGRTGMARRLSWDEPSLTLTCSPAQKQTERCHPDETRPLTVREYARIQTFPDHWKFCGSIGSQYKQIGNAVPVNLGYHIGRCVIAMLSKKSMKKMKRVIFPPSFPVKTPTILLPN